MRPPPGRFRSTAATRWRASARSTRRPIRRSSSRRSRTSCSRATLRSRRRRSSPAARSPRPTTIPAAKVIIIDDLMAAQLFPNGNAVGQRMLARVTTPEPDTFEIIGVVKHQRHTTMMSDGEEGMFFTDGYSQFGAAFRWAVRTSGDPERDHRRGAQRPGAARSAAAADRAAHVAVVLRRAHRADALRVDPDRRLRGGRRDPRDDRPLRRARHDRAPAHDRDRRAHGVRRHAAAASCR